jgi:hypothetical protein
MLGQLRPITPKRKTPLDLARAAAVVMAAARRSTATGRHAVAGR